jgi:hypothetical protein
MLRVAGCSIKFSCTSLLTVAGTLALDKLNVKGAVMVGSTSLVYRPLTRTVIVPFTLTEKSLHLRQDEVFRMI